MPFSIAPGPPRCWIASPNTCDREFADSGKEMEFEALQPCLAWNESSKTYGEIAEDIGRAESWVKVAVNRMRKRYRKLLENEIARTVPGSNIDQEIEELAKALR